MLIIAIPRFVFKLVLVADGNFKADHVRQHSDGDVWLIDGAGMSPNRDEYVTFLASAIERLTVRTHPSLAGVGRCRCRCRPPWYWS